MCESTLIGLSIQLWRDIWVAFLQCEAIKMASVNNAVHCIPVNVYMNFCWEYT